MIKTYTITQVKSHVLRLGRTVHRRNGKTHLRKARMARFLSALPTAPDTYDNSNGIVNWGMMLNDQLGDCTIAGPGHLEQAWTAAAGAECTISDADIEAAYCAFDGYVVGDPSTDNGGDILTVCQDWSASGIGNHKIVAHAEIDTTSSATVMLATYLFGGLNAGVDLPISAQSQVGGTWDVAGDGKTGNSAPGSWGGHCTAIVGYNAAGPVCVTWGALQQMTWRFWNTYYDEAHACLSAEWKNPLDINVADLTADLQQIGQ